MVKLIIALSCVYALTLAALTSATSSDPRYSSRYLSVGNGSAAHGEDEAPREAVTNDTTKTTIPNFMNSTVTVTVANVTIRDGTTINYLEVGDPSNPTMVLVHGWLSSKEFWSKQLEDLVDSGVHVIAYDQRNHGASGPSRELNSSYATAMTRMSAGGLASDLNDFISSLGLKEKRQPITLAGHSMGGMVVLKAMEIFGHEHLNVGGIALVDSSFNLVAPDSCPEEERVRRGALMTLNDAGEAISYIFPGPGGESARLDFYSGFFTEDITPEEWEMVEEYAAKTPLEPSADIFYTLLGAVGAGTHMVDIAINNILGVGVPITGIALCPSTTRSYRFLEERKEEAGVGNRNITIVDLSDGLPDDHRGHFSFWQEARKSVRKEVNKAMADLALLGSSSS